MKDPNEVMSPSNLEQLVWSLFDKGDIKQALVKCGTLNTHFPRYTPGWHTSSQLCLRLHKADAGLLAIEKALLLEPENFQWLLQKANCLAKLQRLVELKPLLTRLRKKSPQSAYQYSTLGFLLTQIGDHAGALEYYDRASVMEPNDTQHYYNKASVYRFLGNVEAAEKNYTKALILAPRDCEAYRLRSELRRQTADRNNIDELLALLQTPNLNAREQVQIYYALAKELEDLERWEESFKMVERGAATRRRLMQYDVEKDLTTLQTLTQIFDKTLFARGSKGYENAEPIFVIGLPRTGTTLVERILASHTDVTATGELNNFAESMLSLIQTTAGAAKQSRDALIKRATELDFIELGKRYIASTRHLTGTTTHFVDKLPLNYLYAGLIHLALPRAKIISVRRHPLDSCYAIYKQLFKDAYPFSYDLTELGRYYVAYHRLMQHWEQVMPGVIYTVRYEELVENQESETRCLLANLQLPWQSGCLEFHTNKEASTTASAVQVRQPLYKSSVNHWYHYRKQLAPLIEILEAAGIDLERT